MFYVRCEDLAVAYVGPFETAEAAQLHIDNVIVARGDGSTNMIVTSPGTDGDLFFTPEEDRNLDIDALLEQYPDAAWQKK